MKNKILRKPQYSPASDLQIGVLPLVAGHSVRQRMPIGTVAFNDELIGRQSEIHGKRTNSDLFLGVNAIGGEKTSNRPLKFGFSLANPDGPARSRACVPVPVFGSYYVTRLANLARYCYPALKRLVGTLFRTKILTPSLRFKNLLADAARFEFERFVVPSFAVSPSAGKRTMRFLLGWTSHKFIATANTYSDGLPEHSFRLAYSLARQRAKFSISAVWLNCEILRTYFAYLFNHLTYSIFASFRATHKTTSLSIG